jgi:hypothetical protein
MSFVGTGIPPCVRFSYELQQEWEIGVDGSHDVLTTRAYVFRYPHIGPEFLFICVLLFSVSSLAGH